MADQKSIETFRRIAEAPFWEADYEDLFTDECGLELPSAPPGMPQVIYPNDRKVHFRWLARTTRDWRFTEVQPYGAPKDGNVFWLMRKGECLASWGGMKDQPFYSRFIDKITICDGKIVALKEIFDPLAFLKAVGDEIPEFKLILDPEAVKAEMPDIEAKRSGIRLPCEDSPEVCEQRKARALDALANHRNDPAYEADIAYSPVLNAYFFFGPPGMDEDSTPHRKAGMLDWCIRSTLDAAYIGDHFKIYPTGDPNVYFEESGFGGTMQWVGYEPGSYRNDYIYRIVFDEYGYIAEHSEALNPINKYNSINVRLKTFPYFL